MAEYTAHLLLESRKAESLKLDKGFNRASTGVPLSTLECEVDWQESLVSEELKNIIISNSQPLLEDEIKVAGSLGIQLIKFVSKICLYEKTECVSVIWTASTSTRKDTIRFGLFAPPNCDRKSNTFTRWLLKQQKEVIQLAIGELISESS